jgi:hypothetical protein
MSPAAFRKLALSMQGASEQPHFERTSFRVGKRIFATMTQDGREAMVPVQPVDRCLALIEADPAVFFGHGGWTARHGSLGIRLQKVNAPLLRELVREAWQRVAAKAPGKGRRK